MLESLKLSTEISATCDKRFMGFCWQIKITTTKIQINDP